MSVHYTVSLKENNMTNALTVVMFCLVTGLQIILLHQDDFPFCMKGNVFVRFTI